MGLHWTDIPADSLDCLKNGVVIPAHPLALDAERKLDSRRQRALTRYYLDAGAGGLAVGVHTTQFEIREVGLFTPVLELAAETVEAWTDRPVIKIAGLVGRTRQALKEAAVARSLGYHAGLLSLAAWQGASEDDMIGHCAEVAAEIPLVGFYLQPAVGGVVLPASFWKRFSEIDNVIAIKMAPFDRYATLDVVRGVVDAGAESRIALYTGNDDHIIADLLTPFTLVRDLEEITVRIVGGLLGHWCVWTHSAVKILERCHRALRDGLIPSELLALDAQVTDCNGAFFDVANGFAGCIAGCHEVLRRQGLMAGTWCINPDEQLSEGQSAEIDRVYRSYPYLNDDGFVELNLERWLKA